MHELTRDLLLDRFAGSPHLQGKHSKLTERLLSGDLPPMRGGSTAAAYAASSATIFAAPAAVHTLMNVISPAGHGLTLVEFGVSFDGVTASAVPCLVELCQSTQAGAGTAGTSTAPVQIRGRATAGSAPTAGYNYTAEPTTLTRIKHWYVSPNGGLFIYPVPLGREVECDSSAGTIKSLCVRITPSATVNVAGYMEVEALG